MVLAHHCPICVVLSSPFVRWTELVRLVQTCNLLVVNTLPYMLLEQAKGCDILAISNMF